MTYYTYILYSESSDVFYKGQTHDIKERLSRHNSGYEIATKSGRPWVKIWYAEKGERSDALSLERKLKNLSRVRLIDFMRKYSDQLTEEGKDLLNVGFES